MAHGDGSKSRITWRSTLAASFPQWILLKVDRREARDDSLIFSLFCESHSPADDGGAPLATIVIAKREEYIHVSERRGMPGIACVMPSIELCNGIKIKNMPDLFFSLGLS